jgi:aldehyde:ferredoxin oxidoreductase
MDDDRVELRPAKHLWGKMTLETDRMIKDELGDPEIKVVAIGPAGENRVRYASIMFTMYRSAGHTGMGAVMGSKNLKAIAVRGTKSILVAEPERLRKLVLEMNQRIMKNPLYPSFSAYGTSMFMLMASERGMLSVRNYQQAGPWEGAKNFSIEKIAQYYTRDKACHACPMHCSHFFEVKDGPYKGEKGGGIEGGLIYPFGPTLDNADLPSMFKILNLCNQYGVDTLELPFTLAAAIEWYENGIITQKETDGITLEWGNVNVIIDMIHKICKREGFGDVLAEGASHAAKKIGKEAQAHISQCKGMLSGSDDSRPVKGSVLSMATSTIPCHHEEGVQPPLSPEAAKAILGTDEEVDPTSYRKAVSTVYYQNLCTVIDAMEICKFVSGWATEEISFKEAGDLFSAVTGIDMDADAMILVGERINTLERAFAVREGMTREDDHLSGKIATEPVQTGPHKGERIDPKKFEKMLDGYYDLRGWDKKTGIPTRAKLEKVGLPDVIDDLERLGKLRVSSALKGEEKK